MTNNYLTKQRKAICSTTENRFDCKSNSKPNEKPDLPYMQILRTQPPNII